jgi:hypothetical protein
VIDSGSEVDLRGLEGVVCGKVDGQEEDTTRVWRVGLFVPQSVSVYYCEGFIAASSTVAGGETYRTHDGRLPVELFEHTKSQPVHLAGYLHHSDEEVSCSS